MYCTRACASAAQSNIKLKCPLPVWFLMGPVGIVWQPISDRSRCFQGVNFRWEWWIQDWIPSIFMAIGVIRMSEWGSSQCGPRGVSFCLRISACMFTTCIHLPKETRGGNLMPQELKLTCVCELPSIGAWIKAWVLSKCSWVKHWDADQMQKQEVYFPVH